MASASPGPAWWGESWARQDRKGPCAEGHTGPQSGSPLQLRGAAMQEGQKKPGKGAADVSEDGLRTVIFS